MPRVLAQPRTARLLSAAVLAASLAACGSTVPLQGSAVRSGDGLSAPAETEGNQPASQGSDGSTGTTVGGPGSQSQGDAGSDPRTATPEASGMPGEATSAPDATKVGVAGQSRAPIKIGVITQQQLETAARAFGIDGVATGDTRKQVDAVVDWIRVNGGLAGRPIKVYQYDADLSAGSTDAVMSQACAAFTQDEKVDYVLTVLGGLRVLAACLKKTGTGLLADNSNFADSTMNRYAPILGNPSELGAGRMMNLLVDHLWSIGWLKGSSKVGVFARDNSDGHEMVEGPLRAALKRHGLTATVTRFINDTQGDGGSSASANAVLGFRSAGVDRVIPAGYSPLYFMSAAESQGYRPAYAMVSAQAPGSLLEGAVSPNQMRNAAGIGWQPFLDIGKGTKPGPVSARETLCFELMRKAGQAATSQLVKAFQVQVCDLLFYLKDLVELRPDIPKDLFTSARQQLGARFVSPATFRVDVSKRTAGMAGYRPLAYKDDCQCFQYTGPLVKTP